MATESGTQDPGVMVERQLRGETSAKQSAQVSKWPAVEAMLRKEPWSFEFFQLVRLLERLSNGRIPVGEFGDPSREVVRFRSNPALQFPPSQIASLEWDDANQPRMSVNFFGVMGHSGVLPLAFSEYINERLRARDTTLQSFLDIFNHRALSFFYQAWEKYRFPVRYERDRKDRVTHYLRDFIGIGTEGLQDRQKVRDESLIFYTGLLSLQPRSADALKGVLEDFFEVRVEVEQFVGAWYSLSKPDQCEIGNEQPFSSQLGLGAVAGDEMWNVQSRARLVIGPMPLKRYIDFLPGGPANKPLRSILLFFSNREISYEAQLVLERKEVPRIQLGAPNGEPVMLSWTTWINNAPFSRDPADAVIEIV